MERIAAQAQSNVRMIYAYYGSKSGLFDATVTQVLRVTAESVPRVPRIWQAGPETCSTTMSASLKASA